MSRIGFVVIFLSGLFLAASAIGANFTGAARSTAPGHSQCAYRPGAPYTADISIQVEDKGTPMDTAVVHLHGAIPSDGRSENSPIKGERQRYVAALEATQVHLAHNSLNHFNIAPRVVVENAGSADCRLRIQPTIGDRSWALQSHTHFTLRTTVSTGGHSETTVSDVRVSCFDQDSKVRLLSGELVPVKQIVSGDFVWNPVQKRGSRVREVIQGTEADETMVHLSIAGDGAWFTAKHPLFTSKGVRAALDVSPGDALLGEDGRTYRVARREVAGGNPRHLVYNLVLDAPDHAPGSHAFSVGGIVSGDFFLQQLLSPAQTAAR